jgi:hypothetical protein
MPSYLDFNSTKRFRDFILGKTLQKPDGPQNFTNSNYSVQQTGELANIEQPDVDFNRSTDLLVPQNTNTFKPLSYSVRENINTLPRKSNLQLYWNGTPYFNPEKHNLIGILGNDTYQTESELFRFAAHTIKNDPNGPIQSRIRQNLEASTVGRVRLLDALNGNTATASNIITGREPLIESNNKITVAKTLIGKGVDFVQTIAGVEFPFSEIPGDYLSDPRNPINYRPTPNTELGKVFQDVTGALGSLLGIQRRPKLDRKPSDLMIEYLGQGQKAVLYDLLSYSKYAPNYTTTARSQNSSKIFNFIDKTSQGVKSLLGGEAPRTIAYIGDDRGNDVKYAMGDFNDIQVRSNYYLSLMFDPIQAQLFQRKRNVSEGGELGGKLTWISRNSKNKLGTNNGEWESQSNQILDSLSTNYGFRENSILGFTQDILDTLPTNGGESRSHIGNVIDQTSRIFKDGDVMLSRGSAIKYSDKFGEESGVEYCRVWTKDRAYFNYSDTMKRTGNIRKYDDSVMSTPWNLNIAPISNGGRDFEGSTNMVKGKGSFHAKKYMFSLENLAWTTSNTPGFTYNDLPYCERGPNDGRIMWFPPYDLKVTEQNSARWESNTFLGRPEPIYTYQNTERSGNISFKIVVDHPSVLNLLVKEHFKGMTDEESENYINAFFAGCEEIDFYDLIRKYRTLTPDDTELILQFLNGGSDSETIKTYRPGALPIVETAPNVQPDPKKDGEIILDVSLVFPNDFPKSSSNEYKSSQTYSQIYNQSIINDDFTGTTISELEDVLSEIYTGTTKNTANAKHDKKILHNKEDVTISEAAGFITTQKDELTKIIDKSKIDYTDFINKMYLLKDDIKNDVLKEGEIWALSSTSAVADNNYNFKLSIRRSHSIVKEIIENIKNDGATVTDKWNFNNVAGGGTSKTELKVEYTFKELGYDDKEGKIKIITYSAGENFANDKNKSCSKNEFKYTLSDGGNIKTLKISAPIAYGCRQTSVRFKYNRTQNKQEELKPVADTLNPRTTLVRGEDVIVPAKNKKPLIDPMKRIIMKTLSECYYFQKLEETDPVVFTSLKEKLKYFHPGFHSTTPEGLNSRLTFLNQCVRPGDTIPIKGLSDQNDLFARNTTFGPPPICVLRVGDFYHSKVIIRDVNITFDDNIWDLNPEGIGVQPMIANVSLQVNFIGGHGLKEPVNRLQNALSSNFYANTEMYDERSINTAETINGQDREQFTKEFLEDIQKTNTPVVDTELTDKGNSLSEGTFIGNLQSDGQTLEYQNLINDLSGTTFNYFEKLKSTYNVSNKKYGEIISSLILHPTYREINTYDVYSSAGGSASQISLFGEYPKGKSLSSYTNVLKNTLLSKVETINLIDAFELDRILPTTKHNKTTQLLKPKLKTIIEEKINSIGELTEISSLIEERNKLINNLDNLNFLVNYEYDVKIDKSEIVTKTTLSGYTSNLLYGEYDLFINYITNNTEKIYEDLDTTSVNFFSPNISDNVFITIMSVLLNDKTSEIKELFASDTTIYDEKTKTKIDKKIDSFVNVIEDKKFKLKKFPVRKNDSKVSFVKTTEEIITDENIKTEVKKLKSSKVPLSNKLNYFKQ